MTLSVQASGVFCLDLLLALALELRAVAFHVARLATQVALPTETLRISSSSGTQFHCSIPTVITLSTVAFTAVLWASRRVLQGSLPRTSKPHSAISAVSKSHRVTNIARVTQHDMPLHILFQSTQVSQQQIMGAHQVPDFQHNGPKLLVITSH